MLQITARDRLKLLGGAAALLMAGCGGGGGASVEPTPVVVAPPAPTPPPAPMPTSEAGTLTEGLFRDTFRSDFKIGAAISSYQIDNADFNGTLAAAQFNSITPSFQLKADEIAPTEGVYNFEQADILVDWAIANGMDVRGHSLVWHESTPDYFYAVSYTHLTLPTIYSV